MTLLLGRWQVAAAIASVLIAATCAAAPSAANQAPSGPLLPKDSADAATFRGGLVYATYCVTCHGINQDGNGRAARLYDPKPSNLRASDKNDAYIRLIVQRGGESMGRSSKMPPWGEELTDEQIKDVAAFVRSVNVNKR